MKNEPRIEYRQTRTAGGQYLTEFFVDDVNVGNLHTGSKPHAKQMCVVLGQMLKLSRTERIVLGDCVRAAARD